MLCPVDSEQHLGPAELAHEPLKVWHIGRLLGFDEEEGLIETGINNRAPHGTVEIETAQDAGVVVRGESGCGAAQGVAVNKDLVLVRELSNAIVERPGRRKLVDEEGYILGPDLRLPSVSNQAHRLQGGRGEKRMY